jgi:hypothetical protein
MSIATQARKQPGTSANAPDYRASFLRDAHRLIARGYARLTPARHTRTVEEELTEHLAVAIDDAIMEANSPSWMHKYHVADDVHVRHAKRKGKKRPRVDIEIINVKSRLRPRFHFEAKRLGKNNGVGKYVGRSGLGCILSGEYASQTDDAGMLGYIQKDTCADWAPKIEKKLHANRAEYQVVAGSNWESKSPTPELTDVYRSQHERPSVTRPIDVYHTLLLFCATAVTAQRKRTSRRAGAATPRP